ncbi:MAG TPA: H-NS histone family protein [Xanthomonadaceae bacterium]|nr:H-NS histone family protein [Xanthomonadaceae bacterium]
MAIDVSNLNRRELEALIAKAEKQKDRLRRKDKDKVRRQLTRLATAEGYTLQELFGGSLAGKAAGKSVRKAKARRPGPGKGTKVPPKYRNPSDPAQTWSGRGTRPRWFAQALERGVSEPDLRI